jgi:dipeptidyl aminopeptidase/acylaminoacyl peptidase
LTRGAPPFLVVHGDRDRIVPLSQSVLLVEALRRLDVPVEFVVIKGGPHGGSDYFDDEAIRQVQSFFKRHVKAGKRS